MDTIDQVSFKVYVHKYLKKSYTGIGVEPLLVTSTDCLPHHIPGSVYVDSELIEVVAPLHMVLNFDKHVDSGEAFLKTYGHN